MQIAAKLLPMNWHCILAFLTRSRFFLTKSLLFEIFQSCQYAGAVNGIGSEMYWTRSMNWPTTALCEWQPLHKTYLRINLITSMSKSLCPKSEISILSWICTVYYWDSRIIQHRDGNTKHENLVFLVSCFVYIDTNTRTLTLSRNTKQTRNKVETRNEHVELEDLYVLLDFLVLTSHLFLIHVETLI